ncbi:MAG TPA: hypothetical protein VFY96_02025 [Candidatus Binatia bacterium]|nr:hypothetical protein [Candidatus Binatia bacterium]
MEVRERPLSTADLAGKPETHDERERRDAEATATIDKRDAAVPIEQPAAKGPRAAGSNNEELVPLFSESAVQNFRQRWTTLQTEFVDEPRRSVEQADELVAHVMKDMAATFSDERKKLEQQWEQGDKVSTEDLRLVLRRYRSFFDRFLSI